jgi:hypothetical protein
MTTPKDTKISEQDMLDSLLRSGYLFESEITKLLVSYGFFVESNLTLLDPMTGKNREIDLVAEYDHPFDEEKSKTKTVALARFVFEIKNNSAPIVLLTKYEYSPNSDIYTGLKVAKTIPRELKDIFHSDFFDVLFNAEEKDLFTQYCSFSKKKNEQKKDELMAHHPEVIYSALQKITYYCEEKARAWNDEERTYRDDYFRNFLYLPVLLINDDLYELEVNDDNNNNLKKVDRSYLVFNYHYKQQPQTSIVHVVTKTGLKDFLVEILKAEKKVEENMINEKARHLKSLEDKIKDKGN